MVSIIRRRDAKFHRICASGYSIFGHFRLFRITRDNLKKKFSAQPNTYTLTSQSLLKRGAKLAIESTRYSHTLASQSLLKRRAKPIIAST